MQAISFTYGNHTDIGRQRSANEDYYGTWPVAGGQLFVVCDGMGGHAGGAEAAQTAVAAIHRHFESAGSNFNPVIALHQSLEAANSAVLQRKREEPALAQMGTTAVVVFIRDGKVWYAHLGDSRIYYSNAAGLRQLTRDHSYVQLLVDSGEISPAEAAVHPRRNEITKAIGIAPEVEPSVCAEPLLPAPGDCMLLCSDGLSGMVPDAQIQEVLRQPAPGLQEKAFRLISMANEAGGPDNSTVQIICFGEGKGAKAVPKRSRSATIGLIITLPLMALAAWAGFRSMNRQSAGQEADSSGMPAQQVVNPVTDTGRRDSVAQPLPVADTMRTRAVTGAEQIPIAVPVKGKKKSADSAARTADRPRRLVGGLQAPLLTTNPDEAL